MKLKYIFPIAILFFAACEDPIDVTLDDAEEQLIVDAWLDNNSSRLEIRLSSTLPYFTNEFTPGVENASVAVYNSNGSEFEFVHESNGNYVYQLAQNESIGTIGDEYELRIEIDGQLYTAVSKMNRVPTIDSLVQEYREAEAFTDEGTYCQFYARDFDGLGDCYWIKTYKNGEYLNRAFEINIAYDAGFDSGGEVDGFVFIYPIRDLINAVDDDGIPQTWEEGEDIRVELHSISQEAFAFMEIMRDQLINNSNGIFAEPLANTRGNIIHQNGEDIVLGVFNVSAVNTASLTIQ